MSSHKLENPFRPGAGHKPPYLAGREDEKQEFLHLMDQKTIIENMVLTGLRGVGKTVLLDTFKPLAMGKGWLWVGTDLSESASVTEENLTIRLLTDLSVVTSNITASKEQISRIVGYQISHEEIEIKLGFNFLSDLYKKTPGLVIDKLKYILEFVWGCLKPLGMKGIIFAYDEAQNLSDQANKGQYPLGVLLDTFQSIQKKGIPYMLALTGLPTLFPKLVDSRTFAERMFRVITLGRLNDGDSRDAILKPMEKHLLRLNDASVKLIVQYSGGYPYFIQFICREVYDAFLPKVTAGEEPSVPLDEITRKLDTDFFAGRWSRATDRQRDLLLLIANLPNCEEEFTVQEIVDSAVKNIEKPFSNSHASQMLSSLIDSGLIYKNRHGKYSFAVPLLGQFIRRQMETKKQTG